jgi:hypothetical protein
MLYFVATSSVLSFLLFVESEELLIPKFKEDIHCRATPCVDSQHCQFFLNTLPFTMHNQALVLIHAILELLSFSYSFAPPNPL